MHDALAQYEGMHVSMRVCFVPLDYPSGQSGGGVGTSIQTLARAMVEKRHQVTVFALQSPGEPAARDDAGVRVVRFPQGSLHWYWSKVPIVGHPLALAIRELERGWEAWQVLQQLHRQEPFDVIELTEEGGLFVALFMRGVPIVARLHGGPYTFCKYTPEMPLPFGLRLSRILQRMALRLARVLIAPSRAHAQEIATELGLNHPPIEVIPNTVCMPTTTYPGALNGKIPATDDPIILYVGRLDRSKGIPALLRAAHQVVQEAPNVRFVFAGSSHPTLRRTDLDQLMGHLSLNGRVQLLGHVFRDQLVEWYQRAQICVLPSYYESFGISALESMAFGVPVVATTAGALTEVVKDRITGFLVPPGNSEALARALLQLLRSRELRQRMGKAGRERALRSFGTEKIVDKTIGTYKRVIVTNSR